MGKRLLFIVPARLGDAVMVSPALALLKQLQPNYTVDIFAFSLVGSSVYQNNPNCNRIYLVSEIESNEHFLQPYDFIVAAHRDSKVLELLTKLNKPIILIELMDQQQAQARQGLNFIQSIFSDNNQKPEAIPYQLFPDAKDDEYINQSLGNHEKYIGLHIGCHGINKKTEYFSLT